jgi:hypothetical protein
MAFVKCLDLEEIEQLSADFPQVLCYTMTDNRLRNRFSGVL